MKTRLPTFTVTRPADSQARSGVAGRVGFSKAHPVACAAAHRRARLQPPADRPSLLPVFFWAPLIAHAIGWSIAGSPWPQDWPRLLVLATMFVICPLIAFGLIALRSIVKGGAPLSSAPSKPTGS